MAVSSVNNGENTENPDHSARIKRRLGWSSLSYATRLTISFAAIAAMTALVALGVLSFVWDPQFKDFTEENVVKVATSVAEQTAKEYERTGGWTPSTWNPAKYASIFFTTRIEITATDNPDIPPENQKVYDSTYGELGLESGMPDLRPSANAPTKTAEIVVFRGTEEERTVGYVRVYVYGSNTLLTQADEDFRESSYQAMMYASLFAIVLAMCIGFLFARNLVNPINRLTKTAQAIKEGDLSARTELTGDDEIARLGETFDEMADSVEKDRKLERRLTTDVAHELRTPLMAIQSTVEAMVDGVFVADTERLETVNSEVQRLSRLVDALLRLSRLENRNTPMKEAVVDVGELVAGIVATHEAYILEAGHQMAFHADEEVYVYGDADMIRQATANLISNAVRYTPDNGFISIRVNKGDLMASIAVQDSGIGLTPEEAKMVFSRFWRADEARNREYGGLGVGLAVVREIVDRHGGWVRVEGKPNEGATFTIFIPLYNEEAIRNRMRKQRKKINENKDSDWPQEGF